VRAWPDAKYFDSPKLPVAELERLLRSKAVLLPGLTVILETEQGGAAKTWRYPLGLQGYLEEAGAGVDVVSAVYTGEKFASADDETFAEGEGAAWAVGWFAEPVCAESYVNHSDGARRHARSGLRAGCSRR
jgi:topoisomerase-4 subunit B